MKRKITYLALCLFVIGCSNLELVEEVKPSKEQFPDEYLAYTETQTKVFVNTSLKTLWNADDRITIFYDTYNNQFKFNGETGADNGTFSKVQNDYYTAAETPTTYAVYPYNPSTSITEEGKITLTLPAIQNYAQNSYGLGANTMVAATETPTSNALYFKSLCSFVVIKLYGTGTVKSIILTGNNGEKIAGTATVTPVYGEAPSATMSDEAGSSITLDCGDGVVIGTTAETATEFWFCIPPTTFTNGFTIKAITTAGYYMEKKTTSEKVFERNTKYTMATIEGVFDKNNNVVFDDNNFKTYCVQNFDEDGDGEISIEEAGKVEQIECIFSDITSLKGIEFFTALTELSCGGNQLSNLDVSKSTALKVLYCDMNSLSSLDVSKNTALTELGCEGNRLSSLDVSKNTALKVLNCCKNYIYTLYVWEGFHPSKLNKCYMDDHTDFVFFISFEDAKFKAFCIQNFDTDKDGNISNREAEKVTKIVCEDNFNITSLKGIEYFTALTRLECGRNQLTSLDVSKNTALTRLGCGRNQLTSLDVSKNTALTVLYCHNNQLISLDVSKNTALTDLKCSTNRLTSLDISKNTALESLSCAYNQISTIYVWEGFDPSKLYIEKDDSASFVVKSGE